MDISNESSWISTRSNIFIKQLMIQFFKEIMLFIGYLKQAEINSLNVFDGEGNVVAKNSEDGELFEGKEYNPQDLIRIPGFNCPIPKGVNDVIIQSFCLVI